MSDFKLLYVWCDFDVSEFRVPVNAGLAEANEIAARSCDGPVGVPQPRVDEGTDREVRPYVYSERGHIYASSFNKEALEAWAKATQEGD